MSENIPVGGASAVAATTKMTAPTIGAMLGTVTGAIVVHNWLMGYDLSTQLMAATGISGLVTALSHWLGNKIGAPDL